MYNPKVYWSKVGKNYRVTTERDDELINLEKCIRTYTVSEERILEVGCGNGRVFHFLRCRNADLEGRFEMCDFVYSFRKACKEKMGVLPARWDGKVLPYDDDEFNFVVSFSVLLHVPSSEIAKFFKEHVRVSNRYLFIATWFETGDEWASHNAYFRHAYYSLFAENGLRIVEMMNCSHPRRANWLLEKIDAQF